MSGRAGARLDLVDGQRGAARYGIHYDLSPARLPPTVTRLRTLVRETEAELVRALGGDAVVAWYEQIRIPSDVWMTRWSQWEPVAVLHRDTVTLRCCAWVELAPPTMAELDDFGTDDPSRQPARALP